MTNENGVKGTIIGFREWISLPEFKIGAIKAKVDTGAKTSSLHASQIKLKKISGRIYVFFQVHPIQGHDTSLIKCRAPFLEKRVVSDSGGHKEERIVIRTALVIGGIKKIIDLTLTDRSTMKYRMLIGRSALDQFYIDPSQSFLCGKTIKQKRFLKDLKEDNLKNSKKSHQPETRE